MLMTRLPDGQLLYEEHWTNFQREYKAAPLSRRLVLDDGRPAVRLSPESLLAPHPHVWRVVRAWLRSRHPDEPPRKRERRCEACGSPMRVARELDWTWAFRCEWCGSLEVQGKDKVGGTVGAGEQETT